jgi:YegS/Rv2252/BmrU family lipid kinase
MAPMIDPARWFIVVNPASGGGRASRFQPLLGAALDRTGIPYRCVESAAPGDAIRLFARAVDEGYRRLLAVGGDGTFNELINGLRASALPPDACLVAAAAGGTGNDWSRAMGIPDDPARLAACMARARTRRADIGIAARADGEPLAFHNVAGAGLDAEVLGNMPRSGPRALAYLFALARTLARYRAPDFEITVDGRITRGRFLLVLASIGPRCGGGMRLTPDAIVDDGWLDLLTIDPLPFMGAMAKLPRLFDGRLAGDPAFRVVRCRSATIRAESPCGVELDGQLSGTTPVTVTVEPGALSALDCRESAE